LFLVEFGEVGVDAFKIGDELLPSFPVTVLYTGLFRNDCGTSLFLCKAKVKVERISGLR